MNKNRKTLLGLILVALVVAAGYFAWKNGQERAAQDEEVVKIGVILPLTGERGSFGQSSKRGLDLAIDEIKKDSNTGVVFSPIYEDSQGKAQEAVSSFEKLAVENIRVVIGPISSQEVLAIAPLAEKKKIVLFSPGASSPELSKSGEFIFRNVPSDLYEASLMADFSFTNLGLRRIGVLYNNSDYGIGVARTFTQGFKKKGGVVFLEGFQSSEISDFRTQLLKFKSCDLDAIYFIGYTELGNMVKQARELGYNCQFLTTAVFEDEAIIKTADTAAEGIVFTSITFDVNTPSYRAQKFRTNYNARYQMEPDGYAAVAYDAIYIIDLGFRIAKEKKCSLKEALYQIKDYPALLGNLTFDKNGDVVLPIKVKTISNGIVRDFVTK